MRHVLVVATATAFLTAGLVRSASGNQHRPSTHSIGIPKSTLSRHRRQIFDGLTSASAVTDGFNFLENVDNFLRGTLRSYDRFQCVERVLCEFMTPDQELSEEEQIAEFQDLLKQVGDNPVFQEILSQSGGGESASNLQPGADGVATVDLEASPGLLDQLAPNLLNTRPSRPNFQHIVTRPSQLTGFGSFRNARNDSVENATPPRAPTEKRMPILPSAQDGPGYPPGVRALVPDLLPPPLYPEAQLPIIGHRRRTIKIPVRRRRQGGWLRRMFNARRRRRDLRGDPEGDQPKRRTKRQLFESFFNDWTITRMMAILNELTRSHSFHPYTNAAYEGYTSDADACAELYPDCPSSPEEVIKVINNRRVHFPNGIPNAENFPWPFNLLLARR